MAQPLPRLILAGALALALAACADASDPGSEPATRTRRIEIALLGPADPAASEASPEIVNRELVTVAPFEVADSTASVVVSLLGEEIVFERIDLPPVSETVSIWHGRGLEPEATSSLYLAREGEHALLRIARGDLEHEIVPTGEEHVHLHTVSDERRAPPQLDDHLPGDRAAPPADARLAAAAASNLVMNLAYTPSGLSKGGGLAALRSNFALGLTRMNEAFVNSRMNLTVSMGVVAPVSYVESSTSLSQIVSDMTQGRVPGLPSGGRLTALAVGIDDPTYNGYSGGVRDVAIEANQVGGLLLAHEFGHLLGGTHERHFAFADGSATIMHPGGPRQPLFSNPEVTWQGQPAGTATRFNARPICNYVVGPGCLVPAGVIVVDDTSPATSVTGSAWLTSSGPAPHGGRSLYSDGGSAFRWSPTLPQTQSYDVYAWWTYHANRSTAVPYAIRTASGSIARVTKNHRDPALASRWNLLTTAQLGVGSYVEVSSANGQACADAIRLVPR
jgi:hypothetical protein